MDYTSNTLLDKFFEMEWVKVDLQSVIFTDLILFADHYDLIFRCSRVASNLISTNHLLAQSLQILELIIGLTMHIHHEIPMS